MIVSKENERLYLTTWNYNAARIITRLAEIVTNNGGRVKPQYKAVISNRNRDSAIREYREKIERYTEMEKVKSNPARVNAIREYSKKLQGLEMINGEPITVTHTTYIRFVLNDTMYYYQVSDNPFFEFVYSKVPTQNGEYTPNCYCMNDKKQWLYDCLFSYECSETDIKNAANSIFDMLLQAEMSTFYHKGNARRVEVDF